MSLTKVNITGFGECWAYNTKEVPGGKLLWLMCKDGVTKMPEPVFVKAGQLEILEQKES